MLRKSESRASPVRSSGTRAVRAWRIGWTIVTLVAVQAIVCGLSVVPVVLAWRWLVGAAGSDPFARVAAYSVAVVPSYVVFALCLMVVSPIALRALGWRTPPNAEMRLADLEWPLLRWVRYGASIHLVRV